MSAFGTKRTSQHAQPMSAFRGKVDIGAKLLAHDEGAADRSQISPSYRSHVVGPRKPRMGACSPSGLAFCVTPVTAPNADYKVI